MSEYEPTVEECIEWLKKKYSRHGEWEDKAAHEHLAALLARCVAAEKVAAAADILAHQIAPGDYRDDLTRYWLARGGEAKCTVCSPDQVSE